MSDFGSVCRDGDGDGDLGLVDIFRRAVSRGDDTGLRCRD